MDSILACWLGAITWGLFRKIVSLWSRSILQRLFIHQGKVFRLSRQHCLKKLRWWILGRPYHGPGQARSRIFCTWLCPSSTIAWNILKKIVRWYQIKKSHDLTAWARAKNLNFLMLLTVPAGRGNGHAGQIWSLYWCCIRWSIIWIDQSFCTLGSLCVRRRP